MKVATKNDESTITESDNDDASNTFTFPVSLGFYTDDTYGTKEDNPFTATHVSMLTL